MGHPSSGSSSATVHNCRRRRRRRHWATPRGKRDRQNRSREDDARLPLLRSRCLLPATREDILTSRRPPRFHADLWDPPCAIAPLPYVRIDNHLFSRGFDLTFNHRSRRSLKFVWYHLWRLLAYNGLLFTLSLISLRRCH